MSHYTLSKKAIIRLKSSLSISLAIILIFSIISITSEVQPNASKALASELPKFNRDANKFTSKAWDLHFDKKYEEALEYWDKALDEDPNYYYALYGKAASYRGMEKYEEALEYFDKVLDIYPNDKSALGGKSYVEGKLGESIQVTNQPSDDDEDCDPNIIGDILDEAGPGTVNIVSCSSADTGTDNGTDSVTDAETSQPSQTPRITIDNTLTPPDQTVPSPPTPAITNNPPIAHDKWVTTNMSTPIDILLPASDPDQNDKLTAAIVSSPSNGTLSDINQENGMVTYTPPNAGFTSADSFMYKVNDGKADSNTGLVTIAINQEQQEPRIPTTPPTTTTTTGGTDGGTTTNNPPLAHDKLVTTNIDTPIDIQLLASDKDNDKLTAAIVSSPSNGELGSINQENKLVTYTPRSGFTSADSFMFKVNDGKVDSSIGFVTIVVNQDQQQQQQQEPQIPISPPPPTTLSITDQLTNLAGLLTQGIISKEEFDRIKQEIMKSVGDLSTDVGGGGTGGGLTGNTDYISGNVTDSSGVNAMSPPICPKGSSEVLRQTVEGAPAGSESTAISETSPQAVNQSRGLIPIPNQQDTNICIGPDGETTTTTSETTIRGTPPTIPIPPNIPNRGTPPTPGGTTTGGTTTGTGQSPSNNGGCPEGTVLIGSDACYAICDPLPLSLGLSSAADCKTEISVATSEINPYPVNVNPPIPSGEILIKAFYAKTGKPFSNAKIEVKACTEKGSGGHSHDAEQNDPCFKSSRPKSTLTWICCGEPGTFPQPSGNPITVQTDTNGIAKVSYIPPRSEVISQGKTSGKTSYYYISGKDQIVTTLVSDPSIRNDKESIVTRVPNLQPMHGSGNCVGGGTFYFEKQTNHKCLFYGSSPTNDAVLRIANNFVQKQIECRDSPKHQCTIKDDNGNPKIITITGEPKPIKITAMNLPWGGLSDIKGNWKPSHNSHSDGKEIDIGFGNFIIVDAIYSDKKGNFKISDAIYDMDRIYLLRYISSLDENFGRFVSYEGGNIAQTMKTEAPHIHISFKK